jgi:hypothetical protein
MASITSVDNDSDPQPPNPHQHSPDEVAAIEALYKNTKANDGEITVAPWLFQEFSVHKARIIKGNKSSITKTTY